MIEKIKVPKYLANHDRYEKFAWWLDQKFNINEYVDVKFGRYKKEELFGWCQPNERTGNIDVVINTHMCENEEDLMSTLAHEFVHVDQYDKDRHTLFQGKYENDPNEKEAWGMQDKLVHEYTFEVEEYDEHIRYR